MFKQEGCRVFGDWWICPYLLYGASLCQGFGHFGESIKKKFLKIYKSLCDFFGNDNLRIIEGHFPFKNSPGECALGRGNPPNSIGIFTNIPGIKFSQAWKNKKSFKYGVISVRVISVKDLEKDFRFVQRLSPKLAKKYGYFLDEVKKWRRK